MANSEMESARIAAVASAAALRERSRSSPAAAGKSSSAMGMVSIFMPGRSSINVSMAIPRAMSHFLLGRMLNVLRDVIAERDRQETLHASHALPHHEPGFARLRRERAKSAQAACQRAFTEGRGTWQHILDEEVAEAYAEDDWVIAREEWIQVAAVAVAAVEDGDKQYAGQIIAAARREAATQEADGCRD